MRAAALLLALAFPVAATADIVDITWSDGAFSHKASIAPKKFLEVCGKQKMGERVVWQFKSSAPTDFNIHYHAGKDVIYPEQRKAVANAEGTLLVPLDQDYCWMWTNHAAQAVDIEIGLSQAKFVK
jgi:hypothetical protein